jgi:hypothetical protein
MPGPKPTATIIKLARGNPGRRPLPVNEPTVAGIPIKPSKLSKRANQFWDQVVGFSVWLTEAESFKLFMWAELHAEFERAPSRMIAGRIAQLRALGSELGLDPGSRARLGMARPRDEEQKRETVESEFFDRHKRD